MNLIINGEIKDSLIELEIFAKTEFGFTVTLFCKPDYRKGMKIVCNNAHEFHFLFDSVMNDNSLAVESNYHRNGYVPWDIYNKFDSIIVVEATKFEKSF